MQRNVNIANIKFTAKVQSIKNAFPNSFAKNVSEL